MQNFMFKSSKGALVFAGLVVIGAVSLVGAEDDPGTAIETSDDINRQKAEFDAMIAEENEASEESIEEEEEVDGWFDDEEESEYLDDDELIDDAEGFDPAPMFDPSATTFDETDDGSDLSSPEV